MSKAFVIIRLKTPPSGPGQNTLTKGGDGSLLQIKAQFPGVQPTPVYAALSRRLPGSRLSAYYQIACPDEAAADELVGALQSSGLVDKAYVRSSGVGADRLAVQEAPTRKSVRRKLTKKGHAATEEGEVVERRLQPYLRPGPMGVNAFWAWDQEDSQGHDVRFVDIEQGWGPHADLPNPINVIGDNDQRFHAHGTAVLGVIVGRKSESGLIGISPRAHLTAISCYRAENDALNVSEDEFDVGNAMDQAADLEEPNSLRPGDVLLLETEAYRRNGKGPAVPVEVDDHVYDGIVGLTTLGVLVIEPAANGAINVDEMDEFRQRDDSGALMVSGTIQAYPNEEHRASGADLNWGKRVDCYAWGEGIQTLGDRDFGGTSGASAIIAGAAILLQTVARRRLTELGREKAYLEPAEMRRYLSGRDEKGNLLTLDVDVDGTTHRIPIGTPSVDSDQYPIGRMPDLMLVIEKFLEEHPLPETNGHEPHGEKKKAAFDTAVRGMMEAAARNEARAMRARIAEDAGTNRAKRTKAAKGAKAKRVKTAKGAKAKRTKAAKGAKAKRTKAAKGAKAKGVKTAKIAKRAKAKRAKTGRGRKGKPAKRAPRKR